MPKFRCSCCENVFDQDECGVSSQYIGEAWGVPQYESWYTCPYCNSTDIEEAEDEEEDEDEEGNYSD